jgi:hypothetical protein
LSLQEAVTGVGKVVDLGEVPRDIGVEQLNATTLVAAIVDIEEEYAVALRAIGRPQHVDFGDVFDHAPRVTRRKSDILNDRICRQLRINLAVGFPDHSFVGSRGSEDAAVESRLGPLNFDTGDPSLCPRHKHRCRRQR